MTIAHASRPVTAIIEEIADVTRQGKASPPWGTLSRRGRKYGVQFYAVTQRPAEIDKTAYGQCSRVWSGRMFGEGDQKRAAALTGVRIDAIKALRVPWYFYRDEHGNVTRERIHFGKGHKAKRSRLSERI